MQFKLDCSKNDIRKVVADIPMDKNYKIGEIQLKKKCFNRMFILWKKHRVDKKLN